MISIDNNTIWAIGIESSEGVMGFYTNFADTVNAHGQQVNWSRLQNGQITGYNQPLHAFYTNLYINIPGTIHNQILHDRSLYDASQDP
ncbi:MAG: hypothetical protein ACTSP4_14765 [Candidatus Hodarchaeales archaeon]